MFRIRRRFPISSVAALGVATMVAAGLGVAATPAVAGTPPQLGLKVLLIGPAGGTTDAWQAALASEGVPYTLVTATGSYGSQTVSLPTLSSGTTGNYNGVVIADSPAAYDATLDPVFSYESSFGVRQVDGYVYPSFGQGLRDVGAGPLDGTTATLTPASFGRAARVEGTGSVRRRHLRLPGLDPTG